MPICSPATQKYWTVCWKFIFPYPCQKTRNVTVCTYDFAWLCITYVFFFIAKFTGCEQTQEFGVKYTWYAFATRPGGIIQGPVIVRSIGPLSSRGQCTPYAVQC